MNSRIAAAFLLGVIFSASPVAASDEEILGAYREFKAAVDAGDPKKALTFAEKAYSLALIEWGAANRQTGVLASNFAARLAYADRTKEAVAIYDKCADLLASHPDKLVTRLECWYEAGNLLLLSDASSADVRFRKVIETAGPAAKADQSVALVVGQAYVGLAFSERARPPRSGPVGPSGGAKSATRIDPERLFSKDRAEDVFSNAALALEFLDAAKAADSGFYASALWLLGAEAADKRDFRLAKERYARAAKILEALYGKDDRRTIEMTGRERFTAYQAYAAEKDKGDAALNRQPSRSGCRVGLFDGVEMELCVELRIPPYFPNSELFKGQEGFVLLRYDVTEKGRVENPSVLFEWPGGVFTERAMKAVMKWKYFPPTDPSGAVHRVNGVETVINFAIKN